MMVARDGIEPPTPAFSGPRSTTELPGLSADFALQFPARDSGYERRSERYSTNSALQPLEPSISTPRSPNQPAEADDSPGDRSLQICRGRRRTTLDCNHDQTPSRCPLALCHRAAAFASLRRAVRAQNPCRYRNSDGVSRRPCLSRPLCAKALRRCAPS